MMNHWPTSISICEVGLRDGLQMEKKCLTTQQKIDFAERLIDAGVRSIEIGSFVNPKAVPQMADTDILAKALMKNAVEGVEYRALVMNLKGLERALESGLMKVKLTASASRTHSLKNLNRTPEDVVRDFADCAQFGQKHKMVLSGAISTAFGCPFEGMIPLEASERLVECFMALGVREISMSDTTGLATPRQVFNYLSSLRRQYPEVRWVVHLHNTRGLATANVLSALHAGVTDFDASFAGLGGCPFAPGASGNIATEDLVYMMMHDGIHTGINLQKLLSIGAKACVLLEREPDSYQLKLENCHQKQSC